MKLVRCIYPPAGKVKVEEKNLPFSDNINSLLSVNRNRIEIFNIHGDLVYIVTDSKKIKQLKLQKGFYLIREKDISGTIIKSEKLVF